MDFDTLEQARQQAIRTLPAITREDIPMSGGRRTVTVLLTERDGRPDDTATFGVAWPRLAR